jgi:biopolymer transport protein ExbB/TolQ
VALITTAWGLSIAIPAFLALYLLQRRIANFEHLVFPSEGADALHALLDRPIVGSSEVHRVDAVEADEASQP